MKIKEEGGFRKYEQKYHVKLVTNRQRRDKKQVRIRKLRKQEADEGRLTPEQERKKVGWPRIEKGKGEKKKG